MSLTKYLFADKDRSVFFTSVTVLGSSAAVVAVSNEQYILTAMAAGAVVVGLIGLLWKAAVEIATPLINTAIQAVTGRFKKFEGTGSYHH